MDQRPHGGTLIMRYQELYPGLKSPYMPQWWSELRFYASSHAEALMFMTLTARYASEVVKMKRADVDLKKRIWKIPALDETKLRDIPLSEAACEIAGILLKPTQSKTSLFTSDGCGDRPIFESMANLTYRNPCAIEIYRPSNIDSFVSHPIHCGFVRWANKQGYKEHDMNMILDIRNSCDDTIDPVVHRRILEAWADYLEDDWDV